MSVSGTSYLALIRKYVGDGPVRLGPAFVVEPGGKLSISEVSLMPDYAAYLALQEHFGMHTRWEMAKEDLAQRNLGWLAIGAIPLRLEEDADGCEVVVVLPGKAAASMLRRQGGLRRLVELAGVRVELGEG